MEKLLKYSGISSVVIGAASVILGFTVIQPKVNEVTDEVFRNTELAVKSLETFENHAAGVEASLHLFQKTGEIVQMTPEALAASKSALEQSAKSLEAMAGTLTDLSEGVTGILAPESERTRAQARKTAEELRQLGGVLGAMRGETQEISQAYSEMAAEMASLNEEAPPPRQMIQTLKTRIQETQAAFEGVILNWVGAVLSVGVGLIFVFLGLGLVALGRIYSELHGAHRAEEKDTSQSLRSSARRSA